ncbi:MAG: archease [archaeon]
MYERFKFLEHTADIKFQAFGDSLEKCFKNAGYALINIICKDKIKSKKSKKITVKGRDKESLLYDFLEEFLYLIDVGGFLISEIKNLKIFGKQENFASQNYSGLHIKENSKLYMQSKIRNKIKRYDWILTAEVFGDNVKNYETETDVKAITYNDIFIKQERVDGKSKFVCQVVVDV